MPPSGGLPATTAANPEQNALPDIGTAAGQGRASLHPTANGLALDYRLGGKQLHLAPEYSRQTGFSLGITLAAMLGDNAAVGVLLTHGADKKEWLLNAGFQLDAQQRFIVTAGQLGRIRDGPRFTDETPKQ